MSNLSHIEHFMRHLLRYFGHKSQLKYLNFEFTPLTDEHFEAATLPKTLLELNINGCREISEKTIMLVQK
jgi:hypothetical protein